MQLSKDLKTHRALIKEGKELREFLLTTEEFGKIVRALELKKDHIYIEGNLFKRYNVEKLEPISEQDRRHMQEYSGQQYIHYTWEQIAGIHASGKVVRKFIKVREFMRKPSDGGNEKEELSYYYGYYTGEGGKIEKVEKKDIFLPDRKVSKSEAVSAVSGVM